MNVSYKSLFIISCIALSTACNNPVSQDVNTEGQKEDALHPAATGKFKDRVKLTGDFNGDHVTDTLYESYISSLTKQETKKEFNTDDSAALTDSVMKNKPVLQLYSGILNPDTFTVTKESQQLGFSIVDNLGDINGDGKDEVGYMINWADESNFNSYHIMTLTGKTFKELLSFNVNEEVSFDPKELIDGKLLIKVTAPKTIQYKFFSDSATIEKGTHTFK